MLDNLYNTDILSLSATLKNERIETPMVTVRKVSKLCGSWLEIDMNVENAAVREVALRLQACALGQASAAILKEAIIGSTFAEIRGARDALYKMLKENGDAPSGRFKKLELLSGVAKYPARHTSTLLAFDAALEAMHATSTVSL